MGMIDLHAKLPLECAAWLAFVRSLPSAATGMAAPCVAHHRIGYRYSQRRVSDFQAMPLLDIEHKTLHNRGVHTFESEHGRTEWEMIARTLLEGIRLGVLEVNTKRAKELA